MPEGPAGGPGLAGQWGLVPLLSPGPAGGGGAGAGRGAHGTGPRQRRRMPAPLPCLGRTVAAPANQEPERRVLGDWGPRAPRAALGGCVCVCWGVRFGGQDRVGGPGPGAQSWAGPRAVRGTAEPRGDPRSARERGTGRAPTHPAGAAAARVQGEPLRGRSERRPRAGQGPRSPRQDQRARLPAVTACGRLGPTRGPRASMEAGRAFGALGQSRALALQPWGGPSPQDGKLVPLPAQRPGRAQEGHSVLMTVAMHC